MAQSEQALLRGDLVKHGFKREGHVGFRFSNKDESNDDPGRNQRNERACQSCVNVRVIIWRVDICIAKKLPRTERVMESAAIKFVALPKSRKLQSVGVKVGMPVYAR